MLNENRMFSIKPRIQNWWYGIGFMYHPFWGMEPPTTDHPPMRKIIVLLWFWEITIRIPHIGLARWRKLYLRKVRGER